MVTKICWIQHTKNNRSRKNEHKDGKALYKLMNNAVYRKTMENLSIRIDVKLVSNKNDNDSEIFGNDLVTIHKNKVTLTLNKPAYIGIFCN